jgi:subtilisin family serine protease
MRHAFLDNSVSLINAPDIWQLRDSGGDNITGKGVLVAVIDTGIDYMHPDLGGGFGPGYKVVGGFDFANNDSDPMDDNGHGTLVAGIIAANGNLKGVAPDANLLAYIGCYCWDREGNS